MAYGAWAGWFSQPADPEPVSVGTKRRRDGAELPAKRARRSASPLHGLTRPCESSDCPAAKRFKAKQATRTETASPIQAAAVPRLAKRVKVKARRVKRCSKDRRHRRPGEAFDSPRGPPPSPDSKAAAANSSAGPPTGPGGARPTPASPPCHDFEAAETEAESDGDAKPSMAADTGSQPHVPKGTYSGAGVGDRVRVARSEDLPAPVSSGRSQEQHRQRQLDAILGVLQAPTARRALGLAIGISRREVIARFRDVAKLVHPDKVEGDARGLAGKAFQKLTDARDELLALL